MKLSIVIPAYNEEDRIVTTLTRSLAYLGRQPHASEILVVSDGSTDNTAAVVEGFHPPSNVDLRCLAYFPNRGKGYATKYGMVRGTGEIIMFMDADYSVPIEAVADGLNALGQAADIAIGSRSLDDATVANSQSPIRQLAGKLYTFIQNRYLGIDYPDTQCGFKLFRRRAAHTLFGMQKLDSVIFDPEILYLARRLGFSVVQFPVTWTHHAESRIRYTNLRKSLFVFEELFRIRRIHRSDVTRISDRSGDSHRNPPLKP